MAEEQVQVKKKMPDTLGAMIGVLAAIAIISGLALGFVNYITYDKIEANQKERTMLAVREALPEYTNDPSAEVWYDPEHEGFAAYPARMNGELQGVAVRASVSSGYGGEISGIVGFTPEGRVSKLIILQHSETPGLGANIEKQDFRDQFIGSRPLGPNANPPQVRQDLQDGDMPVDAITAATISSRAVVDLVMAAAQAHVDYSRQPDYLGGSDE